METFSFTFGPSGARRREDTPFYIGILAPLSGSAERLPLAERKFLAIDVDNFDGRLAAVEPRLAFEVPNVVAGEGTLAVELAFRSLDDFGPGQVVAQVDLLDTLWAARTKLVGMRSRPPATGGGTPQVRRLLAEALGDPVLVDALAPATEAPSAPEPAKAAPEAEQEALSDLEKLLGQKVAAGPKPPTSAIQGLFEEAVAGTPRISDDAAQALRIAAEHVEERFTKQLNLILHHAEFQALEAAWRGLDYLVSNSDTEDLLKLRVLNVSEAELAALFEAGSVLGENPLLGMLRGEPYGCLLGDYCFDHRAADVALLSNLGQLAAALGVPFVTGAAPSVLKLTSWRDLRVTLELLTLFEQADYAGWRELRASPAAQRLCLAMPRFLARLPYGAKTNPAEGVEFEEDASVDDPSRFVWSNACYAMGAVIARAASTDGWAAEIAVGSQDSQIDGLPCYTFTNADGDSEMMCPTEVSLDTDAAAILIRNGLTPLLHMKNSDRAVFVSVPSFG